MSQTLAATLLLVLSTPFLIRYWQAQHPPSLDWIVERVRWALDKVPLTVSLWTGIVLFALGLVIGVV